MSSQIRSQHIRKKYEEEQKHIEYLLFKGWHPLEIADQMTHYMITLLREGIKKRHPDWNDKQILKEMRNKLLINSKLQPRRGLRKSGRT